MRLFRSRCVHCLMFLPAALLGWLTAVGEVSGLDEADCAFFDP